MLKRLGTSAQVRFVTLGAWAFLGGQNWCKTISFMSFLAILMVSKTQNCWKSTVISLPIENRKKWKSYGANKMMKNRCNCPSDWKWPICDEVVEFHRHRKTIEKPLVFTFGLKIVVIVFLLKCIIFKCWPTKVYKNNQKTIIFSLRIENVIIKIIFIVIIFINIVVSIAMCGVLERFGPSRGVQRCTFASKLSKSNWDLPSNWKLADRTIIFIVVLVITKMWRAVGGFCLSPRL